MATSAHPSFPTRPYTSGLGRPATAGPGTGFNPPAPTNQYPPQTYNVGPTGGFGGPAQQQQPQLQQQQPQLQQQQQQQAARLERERAERERREAEDRGVLDALTEEQREEINEAVRLSHPSPSASEEKRLEDHVMLTLRTVHPLRPRQRRTHRLPRTQSRAQSTRLRPPQNRDPRFTPSKRPPSLEPPILQTEPAPPTTATATSEQQTLLLGSNAPLTPPRAVHARSSNADREP